MNKATLKSRATLIGKAFEQKGVKLSRAEQLDLVAKLEGARGWNHASGELKDGAAPAENIPLDSLQLEVAKAYCDGDFVEVVDTSGVAAKGDMLFHFAMAEVGDIKGNRDEAVNLMRQASNELENLADALEENGSKAGSLAAPAAAATSSKGPFKVVTSSGKTVDWSMLFLTDRFGDCEQAGAYGNRKDLADWDKREPAAYDKLWSVCLEEMAFVVELNGVRGVLYETEIMTTESEGLDETGKPRCSVSEAERRLELQRKAGEFEKDHPQFSWVVADPDCMWDGRLGIWGFCPESQLITKDEAHAVIDTLINKFYRA